jgi:hypothetical protein
MSTRPQLSGTARVGSPVALTEVIEEVQVAL